MIENMTQPSAALVSPEEPMYLLCVDDDTSILNSLVRLFRQESFKVLTATSGREALAVMENTKNICLILSDQRMPEMTGAEFLEESRKLAPDAIRIMMTGYSDFKDTVRAINHGRIMQFMVKPWDDIELLKVIRDGITQYLLARENQLQNEQLQRQKDLLEEWNVNLKHRVLSQTALLRNKLEETNQQKQSIQQTSNALLEMFMNILELRHNLLSRHSRNVAALTESMLTTLKLSSDTSVRVFNNQVHNYMIL